MFDESNSERRNPVIKLTPKDLKKNKIFASQTWVNGIPGKGGPTVYTFHIPNKPDTCILIGDGHKRIANSLLNENPIDCEIDYDLGEIDELFLKNPVRAQQKFAHLGIEGIFPFHQFIQQMKQKKL